jgi:hypothetical protein
MSPKAAEAELQTLLNDSAAMARLKKSPYDLIDQIMRERQKEDEQGMIAAAPIARPESRSASAPSDPLSYLLTQQSKTNKPVAVSNYGSRLMEAPQRSTSEVAAPRPATRQQSSSMFSNRC